MAETYTSNTDDRNVAEDVIESIARRLTPDKVFDADALKDWAQAQSVDDIFNRKELEEWALENGFVEEES